MPIFRPRKFTFFPFLILFKRIESIDMTPCVISFLVLLMSNMGDFNKIQDSSSNSNKTKISLLRSTYRK